MPAIITDATKHTALFHGLMESPGKLPLSIYAEAGVVHIIDPNQSELVEKTCTPEELLWRVKAMGDVLDNTDDKERHELSLPAERLYTELNRIALVAQEAYKQQQEQKKQSWISILT